MSDPAPQILVAALALDFRRHTEEYNLACAKGQLDAILNAHQVLDADRTLAAEDAGTLFSIMVATSASRRPEHPEDDRSLKTLFAGPLGYTYKAFRKAMILCEEQTNHVQFDDICHKVASLVVLYPEMLSLLNQAGHYEHRDHVVAVVIACGLRRASQLDLAVMREGHHALVVIGEAGSRSKTKDSALATTINGFGLRASQWLTPTDACPRLDPARLPLVRVGDHEFFKEILQSRDIPSRIHHATDGNTSKLLTTVTRDARVAGPGPRQVHGRMRWHLATSFLAEALGVKEVEIPRVQGGMTGEHHVRHTTIEALIRGGEPIALGVNDALPAAMFVHPKQPADLKPQHIHGRRAVPLVDLVVNNGKLIVQFVERIRGFDRTSSILVVVGVVLAQSVLLGGLLGQVLHQDKALSLVALRFSENRFTGWGTTDTGNRLFNSTRLD